MRQALLVSPSSNHTQRCSSELEYSKDSEWLVEQKTKASHNYGVCLCLPDASDYVVQVGKGKASVFESIYYRRADGRYRNGVGGLLKGTKSMGLKDGRDHEVRWDVAKIVERRHEWRESS